MFIYREELRALLDAIRSGMSAHLVAQPGMGTTTILCRLVANLESEGFVVLNVKVTRAARMGLIWRSTRRASRPTGLAGPDRSGP